MKSIKKINIIIITVFVISLVFSNCSQAMGIGEIFSEADNFLTKGNAISDTISEEHLKNTSNFMYKLLLAIGIIVMFVVGTIIGIQFMIASAEDKAKVKEALIPYVVGCAVIFGAFAIWNIAVNIGQDVIDASPAMPQAKFCSACNTILNEEELKNGVCGYCGESLVKRCPDCDNPLGQDDKICRRCGLEI